MYSKYLSDVTVANIIQGGLKGVHGLEHWSRVADMGVQLADSEGVSSVVPLLFGLYHDCMRVSDFNDKDHGGRAAKKVLEDYTSGELSVTNEEFLALVYACMYHTNGLLEVDNEDLRQYEVEIKCCWDADRLDLGRVGIEVDPKKLCTESAKAVLKSRKSRK